MDDRKLVQIGEQSVSLRSPVYLQASAAVGGTKEKKGPLGSFFDCIASDDMMGAKSWEEAESNFQKKALSLAMEKGGVRTEDLRYLLAGDLLGQSMASSFGCASFPIPFLGLYGACSTCGEALSIGSLLIDGGYANQVACVTSSHFASAEKEFRYPLDYGSQRPLSASWTVSASAAFILGAQKNAHSICKISAVTTGKTADYGIKDAQNMGAIMAPAAADTIKAHLKDLGRSVQDYDRIITGDLGLVGKEALLQLLRRDGIEIKDRHMDCGIEIYGQANETECRENSNAGGSGCGCGAAVLSTLILRRLQKREWSRVLFLPTGAMLSKTSFNEGNSVPGIAHALVLESME